MDRETEQTDHGGHMDYPPADAEDTGKKADKRTDPGAGKTVVARGIGLTGKLYSSVRACVEKNGNED